MIEIHSVHKNVFPKTTVIISEQTDRICHEQWWAVFYWTSYQTVLEKLFQDLLFIVDTFYGDIFYRGLIFGAPWDNSQQYMRRRNRASKTKSFHLTLFSLPIKNLDQPKKFLTRKYTLLEGDCVIFRGSRAMAGIAGVVPLCYRTFVVISRAVYISTSSAKLVMLLQTFHLH